MFLVFTTRKCRVIFLCIILVMLAFTGIATCEDLDTPCDEPEVEEYQTINMFGDLSLTFSSGQARCKCTVMLNADHCGTLTVNLYKNVNGGYQFIGGWSKACSGGHYLFFNESIAASNGTYKMVATIVTDCESSSKNHTATY